MATTKKMCMECGETFPLSELLQVGRKKVCKECAQELLAEKSEKAHINIVNTQTQNVGTTNTQEAVQETRPTKSKVVAGLLAIFLGGLGLHKFYLGRPLMGFFYLIFCWTYIPSIISFFEGLIYLLSSKTDQEFTARYAR